MQEIQRSGFLGRPSVPWRDDLEEFGCRVRGERACKALLELEFGVQDLGV